MVSKGKFTVFRTAIIAFAAIAAAAALSTAAAQPASPARKLANPTPAGQWAVILAGDQTVSHCVMGVRSDAPAPLPGKPQFLISADGGFVLLRVRAAEWTFGESRKISVTLATADDSERQPVAAVSGADMIDIAFGVAPDLIDELAASSHLDIKTEGTSVRLPLQGLANVLPAYRDCLAGVGRSNATARTDAKRQKHSALAANGQ
jgi:hypothetical protein